MGGCDFSAVTARLLIRFWLHLSNGGAWPRQSPSVCLCSWLSMHVCVCVWWQTLPVLAKPIQCFFFCDLLCCRTSSLLRHAHVICCRCSPDVCVVFLGGWWDLDVAMLTSKFALTTLHQTPREVKASHSKSNVSKSAETLSEKCVE